MDTTDLQKFGKAIQEYFTDIFHTNDYFFLSVNTKIFTECIKRAGVDEKKVISDLKDYYIYESPDKYVRLAIAAFQVKTFYELREEGRADFLSALSSFYDTNNIYNDCFNRTQIAGKNNQERIWTSLNQTFRETNLNLFTEINGIFNEAQDVRYDGYTYLRYPYTQLFFLANNTYKSELLRVIKKLQINSNDDYKTIETLLKNNSNDFCPNFLNSLMFPGDSISPEKYYRILAFSIYVYAASKNFDKDLKNPFCENSKVERISSPYEFEIFNDNGKWVLNIYKNKEFLQDDSCNDDIAFNYLNTYVLPYGIKSRIFIQDSDGYIQVTDLDSRADTFMPCVFISKNEIKGAYQNIIEKRFLGKNVFLYKFNTLEECLLILEKDDDNSLTDTKTSLLAQFKGGIKTGRYSWLLGCEPVIPEGCNITKFEDKPAIYSINKQKEFCRIQIIDSKPISNYSFSKENNSGWKAFGLPSVLGFDFDVKASEKKETVKVKYVKKENVDIETFENLSFSGYFDGIYLVPVEAEQGIDGFVKLEDNYILNDDKNKRELLDNKKILPDKTLEIGQEYEFKLSYKKGSETITPLHIKKSENEPFDKIDSYSCRQYKGFYKNTKIKKIFMTNKKVSLNLSNNKQSYPVYFDYSIDEIIANAIRLQAVYKEIDFDNKDFSRAKWIESKVPGYIKNAREKLSIKDAVFFLVVKNLTNLISLNEKFANIPENVVIFIVQDKSPVISNNDEQNYTIKDPDFLHKQDQIRSWLHYISFAGWRDLNNKCIGLISGESEEVINQYGKNPIYKLVYPMIINGDIEFVKKEDEFGFTLASKKLDDKNHEECQSMAMNLLKSFPDLLSYIKKWGETEFSLTKTVYPKDSSGFIKEKTGDFLCKQLVTYLPTKKYLLFKERPITSPHLPTYFGIFDEEKQKDLIYKLPDNLLDAASYCQCVIKNHQKKSLFTYDKNTKELSCKNHIIIPLLIQRILIMFDKEQLNDKEIYRPYRNYKPFMNIPAEAVKCLKRIFGENAIEEK